MIIPRGIGFPHSDISGSLLTYCSPKPFVVRHVLHRLLVPRHSPCALFYLTYFKLSFSLFSVALQSVFFDCLGFLLLIIFSFQCTSSLGITLKTKQSFSVCFRLAFSMTSLSALALSIIFRLP